MAYMSRAPTGHGRRLFELLAEQQEPFFLDVYLLERGYSDRFLASQPACIVCWPSNACKLLEKSTRRRLKCWKQGLLRKVLNKLFCSKATKNALNWIDKSPDNACRMEADQFACFRGSIAGEPNAELCCRSYMDVSPVHDHLRHVEENISTMGFGLPKKVLHIFNVLLEVAYTPAFYQLIGSKRQHDRSDHKHLLDCERQAEEKMLDIHECLGHEIAERAIHEEILPWKRQKNFASIRQLIVSDLSSSRREWNQLQSQVREIGAEIETKLFEDIKDETILEMLGSHCTFVTSS